MESGDCETEEDSAPEACVSPEGPLMPSNSREMRNKAEKQRRDRLNSFINELATLVPMVSRSSKKMDKTSILRLAAVYLRLYQIDTLTDRNQQCFIDLPKCLDQGVLEQLICDQFNGFILIVTASGRIVFASPTVEHLLGHLQTDLMGQSLFNITATDDHEKLRTFLRADQNQFDFQCNFKGNFNMHLKRAGPRSEQPVYEPVKFMNMSSNIFNREKTSAATSPSSSCSSNSSRELLTTFTDYMAFFVQMYRPEPIVDRMIEPNKDEYMTRHLIDGRIVTCDQRISLIAGYMLDEVSGHSAFKYMHRDDVRWVMIALRQMYDRRETRGSSCYRLISRNGQFIYLRTSGFLEIDDQGTVESFVCINTLVTDTEGNKLINEMKKRYSALINATASGTSILTPPPSNESIDLVEDPYKVEQAVVHLIRDLPSPGSDNRSTPSPKGYNESQDCSSTTDSYSSSTTSTQKPYRYKNIQTKRPPRTDINTNVNNNKRRKTSSESSPQPLSPNRSLSPFSKRRSPVTDITTSEKPIHHQPHDHLLQQHHF